MGMMALVMLITGQWSAFWAAIAASLGFTGIGWAGHHLLLNSQTKGKRQGPGLVIGIVFGVCGLLMLAGGLALFINGEFGGAIALGVFGVVFCFAAYLGSRIFSVPKGKKEVLVAECAQTLPGATGQAGQLVARKYIYVDQKTSEDEIKTMQQHWTEKPWAQRRDWAEGKVIQEGSGNPRFMIGFTLLWNVVAWGIVAVGVLGKGGTEDLPWFLFIFPVIGIALATITVRTWVRRRKFGISVLNLKRVPVYLGETLEATIETGIPVRAQMAKEFRVQLVCSRRSSRLDRAGKRHVSEETLWSEGQTVFGSVSDTLPSFIVSVNFLIPDGLPSTELFPEDHRTRWRLEISSTLKGVDYAAQFELPVFHKS